MLFFGALDCNYSKPQLFQSAWDHPIEDEKKKWRVAIKKEFQDMIKKGVWKKVKTSEMPVDRSALGSKWVFKKKSNGVYRACLVALGYLQIPGVDYLANFSLVINEMTLQVVLLLMLKNYWKMELINVETAFLYGELEEKLYLKIPEGLCLVVTHLCNTSNNYCTTTNNQQQPCCWC
jgi:hypothetical protein